MSGWRLDRAEAIGWLRSLDANTADGLVTDPPYSSGGMVRSDRVLGTGEKYRQSGRAGMFSDFPGDNRDQRSFLTWCTLWLHECTRVIKPGGVAILFSDWRQLPTMCDALQAGGFVWRGIIPWNKTEAVRPQPGRPRAQCEYMIWGSNGRLPVDRDADVMAGWFTHFTHRHDGNDRHHQVGKPLPLMRWIVQAVERGGLVIDPFAGSGTTGVAAVLEGYRFAGAELTEHYHAIAEERLRAADGRKILYADGTTDDVQETLL